MYSLCSCSLKGFIREDKWIYQHLFSHYIFFSEFFSSKYIIDIICELYPYPHTCYHPPWRNHPYSCPLYIEWLHLSSPHTQSTLLDSLEQTKVTWWWSNTAHSLLDRLDETKVMWCNTNHSPLDNQQQIKVIYYVIIYIYVILCDHKISGVYKNLKLPILLNHYKIYMDIGTSFPVEYMVHA